MERKGSEAVYGLVGGREIDGEVDS